jgi:hypothetical protein
MEQRTMSLDNVPAHQLALNAIARTPPKASPAPKTVTTAQFFGPFAVGDNISVCLSEDSHLNSGTTNTPDCDANDPEFLMGDHDFVIDSASTYVYVFSPTSGAKAWAYKSNP